MPATDAPTLAEKLAFLSAMPGVQQVIETHMAYVFLTPTLAYKLKKPVLVGHSDCRTLENRERATAKEIWLNRPLAPGIYLGRVPLCRSGAGLVLQGTGPVVDWLIQMKRLPQDRMLDWMIQHDQPPTDTQIDAMIAMLIGFFQRQQARRPPRHLYGLHLDKEMAVNATHLSQMAGLLPRPDNLRVVDHLTQTLRDRHLEIATRDRDGLVIEGHGDLKPEHVCLLDPPLLFDRAEAALELRVVDMWDEAMYLAMECAMLGYSGLGGKLADALIKAGFAPPSPRLLTGYIQFRLVTRARLALDHLRDEHPSDRQDWAQKAQRYLDAATALTQVDRGGDWQPFPDPAALGRGKKGWGADLSAR